jgi:hypothetical protein
VATGRETTDGVDDVTPGVADDGWVLLAVLPAALRGVCRALPVVEVWVDGALFVAFFEVGAVLAAVGTTGGATVAGVAGRPSDGMAAGRFSPTEAGRPPTWMATAATIPAITTNEMTDLRKWRGICEKVPDWLIADVGPANWIGIVPGRPAHDQALSPLRHLQFR